MMRFRPEPDLQHSQKTAKPFKQAMIGRLLINQVPGEPGSKLFANFSWQKSMDRLPDGKKNSCTVKIGKQNNFKNVGHNFFFLILVGVLYQENSERNVYRYFRCCKFKSKMKSLTVCKSCSFQYKTRRNVPQ